MRAETLIQQLFDAIRSDDTAQVHQLLKLGVTPNCRDPQGQHALRLAAKLGNLHIVTALLTAGAEVNAVSKPDEFLGSESLPRGGGQSNNALFQPSSEAVTNNPDSESQCFDTELAEFLQALQSEITQLNPPETLHDSCGETALLAAIDQGHLAVVQVLLKAGAAVNRRDWQAPVPLVRAVEVGQRAIVETLLAAGADVNCLDLNCECSPLGMAIAQEQGELVRLLLDAGAAPAIGDTCASTLGLAAQKGNIEIGKLLLQAGVDVDAPIDEAGYTALMVAVGQGHLEFAQWLVTVGADVNAWVDGVTPLLQAAQAGHDAIYELLEPLVDDDIRKHTARELQKGLQQWQRERCREVEDFLYAAMMGDLQEMKAAIALGMDVNAIGANGQTALMYAAQGGHQLVVQALLQAGANPQILSHPGGSEPGMTALRFAEISGHPSIVELLKQAEVNP